MSQSRVIRPRRVGRSAAVACVVLLPLAFAGLVVAAASQAEVGLDRIPAAIVNNDTLVTTTNPDGSEQQVLAGRQLVTELTGDGAAGFEWTITNSKDARELLAAGDVYAVVEVPADFSKSVLSLGTDAPRRADLSIRTDDAHDYLTGSVAQSVGDGLVNTFGRTITSQYIGGLYSSIGELSGALSGAADGATQLSDGAGSLSGGLSELTDGAASAQSGASALAGGVSQYAGGVTNLSGGVADYVAGVSGVSSGVSDYVTGVAGLSAGVKEYSAGVTGLSGGLGGYVAGVSDLSVGVGDYVGGVSELAKGARTLEAIITANKATVVGGISSYTGSVSDLSLRLTAAASTLAAEPANPEALAAVQQLAPALAAISAGGPAVVGGVNAALTGITQGVGDTAAGAEVLAASGTALAAGAVTLADSGVPLATGASTLAASGTALASGAGTLADSGGSLATGATTLALSGSSLATGAGTLARTGPTLASGVSGVASGLYDIQSGASSSAEGASSLADGAGSLAAGLAKGAAQVPTADENAAATAADVATNPVALTVNRDNEVSDPGQIIATFFVPLGLWIGSFAALLVMRPAARSVLSSSAATGRIALAALARAAALTAAQAALLVLLLHITLRVDLALLPVTAGFALVMALAFTAFHYFLTVALGRTGLVVSLLLLAIQITATGGLYPIQVLASPFQVISPFLPLTYGVTGMQSIIAGANPGAVLGAVLALAAFGGISILCALVALSRVRRAGALGLVPSAA